MEQSSRGCIKCGNTDVNQDTICVTTDGLAKIFDVQNKKYLAVTCKNCGYTEFYAKSVSTSSNVIDFFFGG